MSRAGARNSIEISDVSPANWELQPGHLVHRPSHTERAPRTSLAAQWSRTCLPVHGTRVPSLTQRSHVPRGKACTTATEPVLKSVGATTAEPRSPRACATREARAPQLESSPRFLQLEKSPRSNEDPA